MCGAPKAGNGFVVKPIKTPGTKCATSRGSRVFNDGTDASGSNQNLLYMMFKSTVGQERQTQVSGRRAVDFSIRERSHSITAADSVWQRLSDVCNRRWV